MITRHSLGWKPDLPDQRDHLYAAPRLTTLPTSVDLRAQCPPIYDQGNLGSCTANAIAGALEFDQIKQGQTPTWTPSRLQIYYNERVMEGTIYSDAGAAIRDGVKSVNKLGACPESEWTYDIARFTFRAPRSCYDHALQHRAISYQRLSRSLQQMKSCLAEGYPFTFGMSVYESFESAKVAAMGIIPMPAQGEALLGGHAVLCVGYHDNEQLFIVRNSWGADWGDHGYFYLPYAYLMDHGLSSDFWTIRSVQ